MIRELIEAALVLGPFEPLPEPVEIDIDLNEWGWIFLDPSRWAEWE